MANLHNFEFIGLTKVDKTRTGKEKIKVHSYSIYMYMFYKRLHGTSISPLYKLPGKQIQETFTFAYISNPFVETYHWCFIKKQRDISERSVAPLIINDTV